MTIENLNDINKIRSLLTSNNDDKKSFVDNINDFKIKDNFGIDNFKTLDNITKRMSENVIITDNFNTEIDKIKVKKNTYKYLLTFFSIADKTLR